LPELTKHVSDYYQTDLNALFTSQATKKNTPRDVAILLAREEACMKMQDISDAFLVGRAAASKVLSRIKIRIRDDKRFRDEIGELRDRIRPGRPKIEMWTEASARKN
jgi:hypothetical protein